MTIEAKLDRIIELLEARSSSSAGSAAAGSTPTSAAPAASEKRGRGRPPKEKAPEPPPADDADDLDFGDSDADDDFLGGEEEAPALTHDDVRKALVAYQSRKDAKPNEAKGVLKKVGGVDVLTDLKPEKFKAVIDACKIK